MATTPKKSTGKTYTIITDCAVIEGHEYKTGETIELDPERAAELQMRGIGLKEGKINVTHTDQPNDAPKPE